MHVKPMFKFRHKPTEVDARERPIKKKNGCLAFKASLFLIGDV